MHANPLSSQPLVVSPPSCFLHPLLWLRPGLGHSLELPHIGSHKSHASHSLTTAFFSHFPCSLTLTFQFSAWGLRVGASSLSRTVCCAVVTLTPPSQIRCPSLQQPVSSNASAPPLASHTELTHTELTHPAAASSRSALVCRSGRGRASHRTPAQPPRCPGATRRSTRLCPLQVFYIVPSLLTPQPLPVSSRSAPKKAPIGDLVPSSAAKPEAGPPLVLPFLCNEFSPRLQDFVLLTPLLMVPSASSVLRRCFLSVCKHFVLSLHYQRKRCFFNPLFHSTDHAESVFQRCGSRTGLPWALGRAP